MVSFSSIISALIVTKALGGNPQTLSFVWTSWRQTRGFASISATNDADVMCLLGNDKNLVFSCIPLFSNILGELFGNGCIPLHS